MSIKTLFKKSLIFPVAILVVALAVLFSAIKQDFNTHWVRGEFYSAILIQVLFFIAISVYAYSNNSHWAQKYLANIGLVVALGFYYNVSLSYDPAFPTLGAFVLITFIYIIPALLLLQLIVTLIKKYH